MKFSVTGHKLSECLTKLNSVIPARSPLPILNNILFELDGNELNLLASDLEIFIRTNLEVNGKVNGKVAIPAKKLIDITRTLANTELSFDVNDKNRVTIKTKNGKFLLGGEPADDFPLPDIKDDLKKIELEGKNIRRFISKVIHAVNKDELRRNMSGIFLDVSQNDLKFVATDGFRLSKIEKLKFNFPKDINEKIIIPLKTSNLISRLNNNDDAVIAFDENDLKVSFGNIEIYSKLIDDTFPNYEGVIPTNNDKILKIQKKDLEVSLRRALIFADDITKRVKLEISNTSLIIKADNPEIGSEGEEVLDCSFDSLNGSEDFDKNKFTIAFNAGYLLDAVLQMDSRDFIMEPKITADGIIVDDPNVRIPNEIQESEKEELINISFGSASKAAILTTAEQKDNENFIELVMPIRVG